MTSRLVGVASGRNFSGRFAPVVDFEHPPNQNPGYATVYACHLGTIYKEQTTCGWSWRYNPALRVQAKQSSQQLVFTHCSVSSHSWGTPLASIVKAFQRQSRLLVNKKSQWDTHDHIYVRSYTAKLYLLWVYSCSILKGIFTYLLRWFLGRGS